MTNKNLKSLLILLAIVIAFFAWEYYHGRKGAKELIAKFEQGNCMMTMEGYRFGITKKEFDNLYPRVSDSLKYSKNTGYTDRGNIIKTFYGIKVKQTQFSFADDVFNGVFIGTDFFTGISFNLTDVTDSDISKLKTIFTKNDWSGKEYLNKDGSFDYSNQWNNINDCVGIKLIYRPSQNMAYIGFYIEDDVAYQY